MMGETFKYIAPLAGAMGYNIEDMSVAIGLMANSGIKGSQAGTSLRGVITNLASPSKEVATAMEALGISLTDDKGKIKTFGETLSDLRKSFSKLDEVERTNYATSIAGKEGMSGFLAMINSSDDDFKELTEQVKNCSGAAKEMADVRLDNLSGDVTLFKSALEGAGIAISDQLSPTLREIVQSATEMIPKMQDILVKFGSKLAEIGSKLLPVLISTVEMLLPVITDVLDVIGDMTDELLPSFMDILDTIVPILAEIVKDIAPFISQLLKTVMDILTPICKNLLPPLSKLLKGLLDILSPILDVLAPIVTFMTDLVSTLIGDVVGAIAVLFGYDEHDELVEKFSKLSEAEQAVIDKTTELTKEQDNIRLAMQNSFSSIDGTYMKYDNLIGKLDTMVDSTGKVKEGYEKQVEFIVNDFNEAFGTEISIVDGKIQKYQEEKQAIEDLMVVKKAEAYMNSAEDEYTEALKKQTEYQQNYAEAVNAYNDELAIQKELVQEIKDMEKYAEENQGTIDLDKYEELNARLEGTNNQLKKLGENKKAAGKALSDNSAIISNFDNMTDAIANNDIPVMNEAMSDMATNFIDASTGTEEALEQQTIEFSKNLSEMERAAKAKGSKITQAEVDNAREMYLKSRAEWSKLSGMSYEELDAVIAVADSFKPSFSGKGSELGAAFVSDLIAEMRSSQKEVEAAMSQFVNSSSYKSGKTSLSDYVSAVKTKMPKKTATGGIVTRAQTRIVGEDGAEAIIPLEKNTQWIDKVADRLNGSSASNNAILEKLSELNDNIKNLKIYLDSGALVGEIAPKMDKKLGSIARQKRRGAVI